MAWDATLDIIGNRNLRIKNMSSESILLPGAKVCHTIFKTQIMVIHTFFVNIWHVNSFSMQFNLHHSLLKNIIFNIFTMLFEWLFLRKVVRYNWIGNRCLTSPYSIIFNPVPHLVQCITQTYIVSHVLHVCTAYRNFYLIPDIHFLQLQE